MSLNVCNNTHCVYMYMCTCTLYMNEYMYILDNNSTLLTQKSILLRYHNAY